jgi:hypothetical protein
MYRAPMAALCDKRVAAGSAATGAAMLDQIALHASSVDAAAPRPTLPLGLLLFTLGIALFLGSAAS